MTLPLPANKGIAASVTGCWGQLSHVVSDRSLGKVYFGNYYFLGAEFMTDATRKAMLAQAAKAGTKVMMPRLAPYHTHQ